MNKTWFAHVLLMLSTLIAAFNYSIAKIAMPAYIKAPSVIILRVGIGAIVFSIIHALIIKEKINFKEDFKKLFLCAIFGVAVNQLFFYEGLSITSPINASLMMVGIPVIVLIIAVLMKREKFTLIKSAGIIIGGIGVVLLLLHSAQNTQTQSSFKGDVYILLNAFSYGFFLVLVSPLMLKYHPLTVVKWVFSIGFFMVLPFGYSDFISVDWNTMPIEAYWSITYVIIGATIINYYLNVSVLRQVNPTVAGVYVYLQPVLTGIIAVSWGKDIITFEKTLYSILIFTGIYFVSKKNTK